MTTDEAKRWVEKTHAQPRHGWNANIVGEACGIVLDALRSAEAQVAAMREAAAKVCEARSMDGFRVELQSFGQLLAADLAGAIRALPAPGEVVAVSTFSPASAPAPAEPLTPAREAAAMAHAQWLNAEDLAPEPAFDAEAAIEAGLIRTAKWPGDTTIETSNLRAVLQAMRAAGRKL